jgi:NAD(P)-dependent dehydrogenase (short-subunit alcohol dehydrogenase family)
MQIDLGNKVALVTGGARGIGVAIVRQLARSGAKVVIHYSSSAGNAETLAKEFGGNAAIVRADLKDPQGARKLWKDSVACFGRIDTLVSNAALVTPMTIDDPLEGGTRFGRRRSRSTSSRWPISAAKPCIVFAARAAARSSISRAAPLSGATISISCTTPPRRGLS